VITSNRCSLGRSETSVWI